MRTGTVFLGALGAIVIGVIFWLALFGVVQLNRPAGVAVGPGVTLAPAPAGPAGAAASAPAGQMPGMAGMQHDMSAMPPGQTAQAAPAPTAAPLPNVSRLPAPQIAPPVNRTAPAVVKVEVEITEVTALLDDGVAY